MDVTSISGWERGQYLPRPGHRRLMAEALRVSLDQLFDISADGGALDGHAALVETYRELPGLLIASLARCKRLRALRLAAPYPTSAYVQQDFRTEVGRRLLAGDLEVERIEVFYSLERLKEVVGNVIRYDGCGYRVRGFAVLGDVMPGFGGYWFDDADVVLGAYWASVPPGDQPNLHLSGEPFRTFFKAYWGEIWRRGEALNLKGAHDLSALRRLALPLGLPPGDWADFVEEARALEVGDGAPPLP